MSLPEAALLLLLPPLASSAWLALISAHAGRLLPWLALGAGLLDLAAAIALVAWLARAGRLRIQPAGVLAVGLAIGLTLRLALVVSPAAAWPALLDGGWYAATGRLVEREGDLRFTSAPLAALDDPSAFVASFSEQRLSGLNVPADSERGRYAAALASPRSDSATMTPWHPPALATWLAAWTRWFGEVPPGRALWPWAFAWLLATAALAAQIFGARAAPGAVLVAGLGPAFTFYGAAPYAELPTGALALGGLVALGRAAGWRRAAVPWSTETRQAVAALGGLLLGMAALFKVDLLPAAGLALLWWLAVPARRDPRAGAITLGLLGGLALPLLHFLLLGLGPTETYLAINGWGVRTAIAANAWLVAGGVAVVLVGAALRLAVDGGRPPRSAGKPVSVAGMGRGIPWARVASALVLAVALLWSFQAWRASGDGPASMPALLAWMTTPLAAWAAAASFAATLEDTHRHRLRGVLAPALLLALLPLLAPLVTRDLSPLYVARRLVPVCLPLTAALAGDALARLAQPGRRDRQVAALLASGVVAFALWGTAAPWAPGRELAGSGRLLERVAQRVSPGDVLVLPSALGGDPAGRLGLALWAVEGVDVAAIGGLDESPGDLASAVLQWREQGRRVLWAGGGDPPRWPGIRAETVGREGIVSEVLAPDPALPPTWQRFEIEVSLYELVARDPSDSG